MALIHLLQQFAVAVSARDTAPAVVLAATLWIAISAYFLAPTALRQHRLALGALVLGALGLIVAPRVAVPTPVVVFVILAVTSAFSLHTVAEKRSVSDPPIDHPLSWGQTAVWIGGAFVLFALFVFSDLGGYAGTLMVWEPEAMQGFVGASKSGISWPHFAASRLLWGQGLMSTGSDSFLYGSGTYALWQLAGASSFTLRLTAGLWGLACLPIVYRLGLRFGGVPLARAAVVVMALNPVLIFYGRYGVALSATIFAVMLLLLACERLFDPSMNDWRVGLAVAGAAFLATLGYAPGRVVAVAVTTMALLYGMVSWRRLRRQRRLAVVFMFGALAGLWILQASFGTPRDFIDVRGEQIMSVSPRLDWVEQVLADETGLDHLTLRQRAKMADRLVAARLPQLKTVISFSFKPSESAWHVIRRDPPALPLIQGTLLLFAVWGFVRSVVEWRRGWPLVLTAVTVAVTLPLLLTNRLDVHRMSLTSLPLIVWAALGLVAANEVMRECRLPLPLSRVFAASFVLLLAAENSTFLFYPHPTPQSPLAPAVQTEIESVDGPLAVAMAGDHLSAAGIEMVLVNRQRLDPGLPNDFLPQETVSALTNENGPDGAAIVHIEGLLHQSTVILAPQESFEGAIQHLRARGMRARAIGDERTGMWRLARVPAGELRVGDNSDRSPAETPSPRRSAATNQWSVRPRSPVTKAHVLEVYYGLTPPQFEVARNGEPVVLRKAAFSFGISMHAWTHMLIKVPEGAVAMESVIGLANDVSGCESALATFEVWDDNNRRIFESDSMGADTPPSRIQVPLGYNPTITLVLTEAGNGPDCDQAIWAEPYFILGH